MILENFRNGKATNTFGTYYTGIFGLPDDMLNKEYIDIANAVVMKIANYLYGP